MMIFTLLAVALFFFFLEIFVPGGLLAVLGFICILFATAFAASHYGWIQGLMVFIGGSLSGVFLFFIEVKWLVHTPWGKLIQHNQQIKGSSLKKVDVTHKIGTQAETVTRLTPSGKIRMDGAVFEAKSENGWVNKGEPVIVTGSDVFYILVRRR